MIEYRNVAIDDALVAEAWVDDTRRWNGWVFPYFPYGEAERVLEEGVATEWCSVSGYRYDEDEDTFYIVDEDMEGEFAYEGTDIVNERGELVGRGYPIGAGEWIWSYAD